MDALDGNAVAGALADYFGADMTTARGSCAHCGAESEIAELVVYLRGLDAVIRCRGCGEVVLVVVSAREPGRVELSGFRLQGAPRPARPAS